MTKCRHADRYKGVRAPSCGCDVCAFKWRIAELERQVKHLASVVSDADERASGAGSAASTALYVANYCR